MADVGDVFVRAASLRLSRLLKYLDPKSAHRHVETLI
jgi:hypothetical protein